MKNSILILLLLLVTGLALTTGFTEKNTNLQATNPQINIKAISEHGLSIIGPADPSFDNMITRLTQGKQDVMIETLRPFSVFIKNTGKRSVVAYTLKWEIIRADGAARVQTRDYVTLWKLMGVKGSDTDGYILKPNSSVLVSPSNIEPRQESATEASGEVSLAAETTAYLDNLSTELSRCISITVTLDGAIFDDGTFVGPDSTGFFAKVETRRNAKRDLIREIKQELQQGKTARQALQHADDLARGAEPKANSSTPPDDYHKNKKDAAMTLLQMRMSVGDERAIELMLEQIHEPVPEIRKY